MRLRTTATSIVATSACLLLAPSAAAAPATPAAATTLMAMSTSWPTPTSGVALAYPSRDAGATPSLFETTDGGSSWATLPTPPLPFPEDNTSPTVVWHGGYLALTDGTHVLVSTDGGTRWTKVAVAAPPAGTTSAVEGLRIRDGVLFALVGESTGTGKDDIERVESAPVSATALTDVPGISVTGSIVYGDLGTNGPLQVTLGHDYVATHYWDAPTGTALRPAPAPCPGADVTYLGGGLRTTPVALCASDPSSTGPGSDTKQAYGASALGDAYHAEGTVVDGPNEEGFAAASSTDLVVSTQGWLSVSTDGGHTYTSHVVEGNGAFWEDLAFQSTTVGEVVDDTLDNAGNLVGTVERTTDGGRTWHALTLPGAGSGSRPERR